MKIYPLDGGRFHFSPISIVSRVYVLIQPFLKVNDSSYRHLKEYFLKYLEIVMCLSTLWALTAFTLIALGTLRPLCEWAQAVEWEATWKKIKEWRTIASDHHVREVILDPLAASQLATWTAETWEPSKISWSGKIVICFQLLHFGMVCYAAQTNWYTIKIMMIENLFRCITVKEVESVIK